MDNLNLSGKVALVTGAGSGIGKATAKSLAQRGARVALLGLGDDVKQAANEIKNAHGEAFGIEADVSDANAMRKAVDEIIEKYSRLDIVVANAGINGVWAPIDELDPDEFKKTVDTNLIGTYITLHYTAPKMYENGGAIVVTASINGTRTFTTFGATAYSSTKAAQVALVKMLALELAKHRIRVNVICPGAIETNIEESTERQDIERAEEPMEFPEGDIPLTDGQPGSSQDVANLILFLVSDLSSHITGTEVWIDGGQSLMH